MSSTQVRAHSVSSPQSARSRTRPWGCPRGLRRRPSTTRTLRETILDDRLGDILAEEVAADTQGGGTAGDTGTVTAGLVDGTAGSCETSRRWS